MLANGLEDRGAHAVEDVLHLYLEHLLDILGLGICNLRGELCAMVTLYRDLDRTPVCGVYHKP